VTHVRVFATAEDAAAHTAKQKQKKSDTARATGESYLPAAAVPR
jgi:hypothetical protein